MDVGCIRTMIASFFLAGFLLAAPAMAGEDTSHTFDANGDGKITFEEVMKKLEKSARPAFDRLDHNKDGVLSEKDFDDVRNSMRKFENWLYDMLQPLMEEDEDSGPKGV